VAVGVAGVSCGVVGSGVRGAWVWRERDAARRELAGRLSPELARALVGREGGLALPTERRAVSVVFFDLAGFGAMTAAVGDERALALLNEAMGVMAGAVRSNGGFVNKFLGDGLMALFNAPSDLAGHERAALCAVRDAVVGLGGVGGGALVLRAGVASGEALVGDCGAPPVLRDYTAVGGVVNDAAHLEQAAKAVGERVLVMRGVWEAAESFGGGVPGVSVRGVGGVELSGRGVVSAVAMDVAGRVGSDSEDGAEFFAEEE
jgi:adenylate cyclase